MNSIDCRIIFLTLFRPEFNTGKIFCVRERPQVKRRKELFPVLVVLIFDEIEDNINRFRRLQICELLCKNKALHGLAELLLEPLHVILDGVESLNYPVHCACAAKLLDNREELRLREIEIGIGIARH